MSRRGLQPERVSMKNNSDLSFRESVDVMFNRAVSLMDLSPGFRGKDPCL